jgi:hypothetical protein
MKGIFTVLTPTYAVAAVVPSAGSSSAATPVLPGSDILLNLPHGSYLSGVVATGTSTVYIQGGDAT